MKKNYKFNYSSLQDIKEDMERYNIHLPLDRDLSILQKPLRIKTKNIANRLVVQPMEGTDSENDGSPGELTLRRYRRYARGGAGIIWLEAVAVNKEGRANKHQLYLRRDNVDRFTHLVEEIKNQAQNLEPYLILQLTHAGRFGEHKKFIFHHDVLDKAAGLNTSDKPMSDEELSGLVGDYYQAAKLAAKAGFDAVDIKTCHRYLLSELLAAHLREGKYGGSYENRTRLIKEIITKIANNIDIDLAIRLNVYDAIPYPYGWGSDEHNLINFNEPLKLVKELDELGVKVFNVSASTPYLKPHISRPYDEPGINGYSPPEHPLLGIERLLKLARKVQDIIQDKVVVGTGFTWLRQFSPYLAAGVLNKGWVKTVGFGRMAFAYPDFASDLMEKGRLDKNKVCLTCGKCTDLKAAGKITGCVVRDRDIYLEPYRKLIEQGREVID